MALIPCSNLAAYETGALRDAKGKLERSLEDLTLQFTLERRQRLAAEEVKALEVSKLLKVVEYLKSELEAANEEKNNGFKKIASLQHQLELLTKDQKVLHNSLAQMEEVKRENTSLKTKNVELEQELLKAKKYSHDNTDKLHGVEKNYLHLRDNLKNLEDKISNLEDENHILRQKAFSFSPRHTRTGSLPFGASPSSPKSFFESSPVKLAPLPHNLTELRRSRMNTDRHEEYHELLQQCLKDDMGFKKGKPVAACIIYRCLLHWGVFEAERTTFFDFIIQTINTVLKTENENDILPYWLANASALLYLLQRNLRSKGFIMAPSRSSSDPRLSEKENDVPSFFIHKLVTQVFSFINVQLFNSLLLRRECCTFSNSEYVKSGLYVLEKWIVDATEEHAGAAWDGLKYIRQAVDFLIIPQKSKRTLDQIKKNICPALSVRQIYRLCTMYWDDKYGTHSVSAEVVTEMRDLVSNDAQNSVSNLFLLDDDLSIPFTTEEIAEEVPTIDMSNIEMPSSLRHVHSAQFLT